MSRPAAGKVMRNMPYLAVHREIATPMSTPTTVINRMCNRDTAASARARPGLKHRAPTHGIIGRQEENESEVSYRPRTGDHSRSVPVNDLSCQIGEGKRNLGQS